MFNLRRSTIRDAGQSLRRNSLMSLASIISMTAALIILGIFLVITMNIRQITKHVEGNLQIQVYMTENCTQQQKDGLKNYLNSNNLIQSVKYESKATALKNFSNQLNSSSDLTDTFNAKNNPMPESYIVRAKNADNLGKIKKQISQYNKKNNAGIEYIKYGKDYIKALTNFSHFINLFCIFVVIVLSVISYFLIYNTIKLTVFARRKEIGIMKYVGATDGYIRAPFILEGAFLGIIAALAATLAVRTGYFYILGYLSGNALLPITANLSSPAALIGQIVIFFLVYGILIGTIGSRVAIRKFLDV
ncbi:permease-like cell division protein FtsX [uncultured Pseudoramibacter sp.]|jgi:cell division transport system permease protein|uniref:Cell division protein FtsX n=1 Tax=Candidatus Pseudoramibacter fermentans TaxID=2594427 RepID=A0A6L5GRD2_9FIRM|nr:permease-like cell division protein FtsX [uncultured Pseudoramibacter sp.]MQM72794.1 ABC transporter permease [Candidatus Pseudoramibacter fermentans]RRF93851.1 MAG: ABC transporter permease [Eubacteriaceae bacterium]